MTMVLVVVGTAPAFASTTSLDGPNPAIWLSDPEGNDGTNGIERGDPRTSVVSPQTALYRIFLVFREFRKVTKPLVNVRSEL